MNICIVVLRWLLAIPVAVITGMIAYWSFLAVTGIGVWLRGFGSINSGWIGLFCQFQGSMLLSVGAVYGAMWTAPGHKRVVGFVLAVLLLILFVPVVIGFARSPLHRAAGVGASLGAIGMAWAAAVGQAKPSTQ
jgi:hypothetical protein